MNIKDAILYWIARFVIVVFSAVIIVVALGVVIQGMIALIKMNRENFIIVATICALLGGISLVIWAFQRMTIRNL